MLSCPHCDTELDWVSHMAYGTGSYWECPECQTVYQAVTVGGITELELISEPRKESEDASH